MRSLRKLSRRKVRGRVSKTARRGKRRVSKRRASKRRVYKKGVSKRRVSKRRVLKRRVSKRISRRNLRGGSPGLQQIKGAIVGKKDELVERYRVRQVRQAAARAQVEEDRAMGFLRSKFTPKEIEKLVIVKPNSLKNVKVGDRVIPGFSREDKLADGSIGDYPPARSELNEHIVVVNGGVAGKRTEHYPKKEREVSRSRGIGRNVVAVPDSTALPQLTNEYYPKGTNFGTIVNVHPDESGVVEVKWDGWAWPAPNTLQYRCGKSFRSEERGYDAFYDLKLALAKDQPPGRHGNDPHLQPAAAAAADEQVEPEPEP
jgi:hypothetical protein